MTTGLSARLRVGYASGGIATGAFGTVPGLLLLPYLTDSLGISALVAGLIVFLPKAWDVVLNPITGRLSDRWAARHGSRRAFLLVGGLALAVSLRAAVLRAARAGRAGRRSGWWSTFLLCATAYSVFQVPYVALPAELTDEYAERTRLLTWRVAILAVAILLSGATAPLIRNAVGGAAGLPGDGGLRRRADRDRRPRRVRRHPRRAGARPGRRRPAGWSPSCGSPWRSGTSGVLLITFVLQALGIGAMLAGVDYVARQRARAARGVDRSCSAASSDRRCWSPRCGSGWPAGSASGAATCSARWCWPSARSAWSRPATLPVIIVYVCAAVDRDRLRRLPAVPAGHAARHRRRTTPGVPARTGSACSPASGRPARPSGWRSGPASTR